MIAALLDTILTPAAQDTAVQPQLPRQLQIQRHLVPTRLSPTRTVFALTVVTRIAVYGAAQHADPAGILKVKSA